MLLFEMVGCPGIGKTTLCKRVTDVFRAKGLKVANLRDFYFQHRRNGSKTSLICRVMLDFTNYPLYLDAVRIKLKYGNHNTNWNYVGSLIFLMYELLFVKKENKYDMLLLDEGIVQFISSLLYLEQLPSSFDEESIYTHLAEREIAPFIFLCDIDDMDENIRRLRNRNVDTRFFRIKDDNKLKQVMETRKQNLHTITSGYNQIFNIDMNLPVEENEKTLVGIINREIGLGVAKLDENKLEE